MADDRDLNEFMGLKKYAPYRREKTQWDPNRPRKIQKLHEKLSAKGVYDLGAAGRNGAATEEGRPEKKRMGKKERLRAKAAAAESGGAGEEGEATSKRPREEDGAAADAEAEAGEAEPAKKTRRRHKKAGQVEA